jgi:uncharacterized protein (TIGR03083 family)
MDLTTDELMEIGFDALEREPAPLPPGLASRVLGAAGTTGRPPMHPGWTANTGELSSHAAFITTAAGLGELLGGLGDADWTKPTAVEGGVAVRDLVQHLVGVARYFQGQLGRRKAIDAPTPAHHYPVLRAAAGDLDGADGPGLARAWWLEVMQLTGACAELGPDHPVAYHDLAGTVQGMLVMRTFELWTHDDDIRRAVGLPLNLLDDARLSMMSTALLGVLPYGMARAGTTQPGRTVRFDLTGPGGGTSLTASLSPESAAGEPDLVVRTSTLDLCRVASNRLAFDDLDVTIEGDRSLLRPVLVGATAFAMD